MKDPLGRRRASAPTSRPTRVATGILVAVLAALVVARGRRARRPHRRSSIIVGLDPHDHAARGRPLRHGQALGHEGHRVLPRLRAAPLVVPPRRDRVRREGDPGRRLRAHHRHEQPRRGRPRGRAAHLPAGRYRASASSSILAGVTVNLIIAVPAVLRRDRRPAAACRRPEHDGRPVVAGQRRGTRPGCRPATRSSAIDGGRSRAGTTSRSRHRAQRRQADHRSRSCATAEQTVVDRGPERTQRRRRASSASVPAPACATSALLDAVPRVVQRRWARRHRSAPAHRSGDRLFAAGRSIVGVSKNFTSAAPNAGSHGRPQPPDVARRHRRPAAATSSATDVLADRCCLLGDDQPLPRPCST